MKKNNTSLYLAAIFAVALLVGVGYAALSATLKINGQTTINKATWDVHFEKISTNDPSAISYYAASDTKFSSPLTTNAILSDTTLNYKVKLTGPDATADVTHDLFVEVANKGTIDATISGITLPTIDTVTSVTPDNATYPLMSAITIKCSYNDGTDINMGDVIKAGTSKTIKCSHHYKSPSELDDHIINGFGSVSASSMSANTSLILNFVAK